MIMKKACPELLEIPFLHGKAVNRKSPFLVEVEYLYHCFQCLDFLEAVKEERKRIIQVLRKNQVKKNEKKD